MKKFGNFCLKLMGWKVLGELPKDKKYLLVVAPHTSNWDFIVGLFTGFKHGVKIHFIAKNQLFFFPLGLILRALGGFSIDRSKKNNNVEKIVALFESQDAFRLTITPEGTRGPVTRWKEGFYYIAVKAKIPLVFVGLDYPSKEVRISEPFWPTGDINKEFPQVLDYFRPIQGRYPKLIPEYVSQKIE